MKEIIEYLNFLFPNPRCELNYKKDYELLIATMLSAQTTDKRVNEVTAILFKKYDSLEKLKNANIDDIIKIIRPIGTYNKKSLNIIAIAKKLPGYVPNDRIFLESLPGVGRKTANVVLSNIYHVPCIAVDTHVQRVSKRLNLVEENDDINLIEEKLTQKFKGYDLGKIHHQLVLFGRYHCKAIKPNCFECKLKKICEFYLNKNNL